jgi:hypothetical protein
MRYCHARSNSDKSLHVIYRDERFDEIPDIIRNLGPWQGGREGEIADLKPHYRAHLEEQGFAVIYAAIFSPDA